MGLTKGLSLEKLGCCSSVVEHFLGKEEVMGSSPISSSGLSVCSCRAVWWIRAVRRIRAFCGGVAEVSGHGHLCECLVRIFSGGGGLWCSGWVIELFLESCNGREN